MQTPGGRLVFPRRVAAPWLQARASDLKIISIDGDSMEPVLQGGDKVLIDTSRTAPSPPGIFVLHDGLGLVAKQIEYVPNTEPPSLKSNRQMRVTRITNGRSTRSTSSGALSGSRRV